MNGEAKHAPPPYRVCGYDATPKSGTGLCEAVIRDATGFEIARAAHFLLDTHNATAELFAASPDLLQALTELTQSASEYLSQVPPDVAPKNAEILRADIAKGLEVIARAKGTST